ncbi:RNA polymerase sigma-70 factor [Maribacter sp. PR1]|uniref:RNA polymerase sigma-70 factor n=1 Tax=Maribacter cobaltidurans TaxID=1178778 RepID=A0ABU7IY62_9FLAO|nr:MULTISPECIES: RNA polymerase sigma-70 factor [Maribacter]MDC6390430.1 RNA polymerase sigma-70 factor [Maribacter sp. PR1]MEE1977819.1 RNA polymerase sigma-70 factor [Maribacter cobaltidurans]
MANSSLEDDKLLVSQLKQDDGHAFNKMFNTYWQPLFTSAFNLLKDKKICEEIVQDVFIGIWKNRKNLEIKVSLENYLFSSVRYQVFNQFRKNRKNLRPELFENLEQRCTYENPESEILYKELAQKVDAVVEELPKKCRAVYKMSRDEQLSHKEISSRLNISPKTVENHITKALFVLRTSIGGLLGLVFISALPF